MLRAALRYCEQVLSGRRLVDIVYEDNDVLAYHHTRPFFSAAHIVVVPKRHVYAGDDVLERSERPIGPRSRRVGPP